jgi:hypothetical protein
MATIFQANTLTLADVIDRFSLQEVTDASFFPEYCEPLPDLSDEAKRWLDKVQADFLSITRYSLQEEIIKLMVLAPILSIADLSRYPFIPKSEQSIDIEIPADDQETDVIRGRIDILVLHQRLWAVLVEAKRHQLNVWEGLPQALTYMMASPNGTEPNYALVLNGTDFLFVKLLKQGDTAQYAVSRLFSMRNQGQDFYDVVRMLNKFRELFLGNSINRL